MPLSLLSHSRLQYITIILQYNNIHTIKIKWKKLRRLNNIMYSKAIYQQSGTVCTCLKRWGSSSSISSISRRRRGSRVFLHNYWSRPPLSMPSTCSVAETLEHVEEILVRWIQEAGGSASPPADISSQQADPAVLSDVGVGGSEVWPLGPSWPGQTAASPQSQTRLIRDPRPEIRPTAVRRGLLGLA